MAALGSRAAWARGVALLACAAIVAHWILLWEARPAEVPEDVDFGATWVLVVFAATFLAVGTVTAVRHPRNAVAWAFLAIGALFALDTLASSIAAWALVAREGPAWLGEVGAWFHHWAWFPAVALAGTIVLVLFPDGRTPSPRWRWLPALCLAAIATGTVGISLEPQPTESFEIPNPYALPDRLRLVSEVLAGVGVLTTVACLVPCAAALVVRFRRSAGVERQQLKLLALVAAIAAVVFPLAFLLWSVAPWVVYLQTIVLALLPVAAGVAILRYRLWDIDVLINRALVYGALAVLMGVVYAAVIGAFATLLNAETGLWPSLAAAGVAVALVQPARAWLQRRVNRVLYGDRDEPYAALSRLGRRLEETPTPEDALGVIVETVAQALRLPAVAIELEHGGTFAPAASVGDPARGAGETLPLVHRGELVGRLVVHPRAGGEELGQRDLRLLGDLARQAGAAVHAVRLTAELRRSREHTVAAREEERRRLRRDLHDGLGPTLAGIVLKLDGVRSLVSSDPVMAEEQLLELRANAQDAIAEIRRLVYELRPPALDELGLVGSLRERAATLGARIEAPDRLPALPAAVEVAAYRIALEGMTNAARHAQASECVVRLSLGGALEVEVSDDGCGIAPGTRPGIGLVSMRERASELGGTLDVGPAGRQGTRIRARLPLRR